VLGGHREPVGIRKHASPGDTSAFERGWPNRTLNRWTRQRAGRGHLVVPHMDLDGLAPTIDVPGRGVTHKTQSQTRSDGNVAMHGAPLSEMPALAMDANGPRRSLTAECMHVTCRLRTNCRGPSAPFLTRHTETGEVASAERGSRDVTLR